jgi:hypothetical protein
MERRNFLLNVGGILGGMGAIKSFSSFVPYRGIYPDSSGFDTSARSGIMNRIGHPLAVKPVLLYNLLERKEADSWREWGGLETRDDVEKEILRINEELRKLDIVSDFQLKLLPLFEVNSDEKAVEAADSDYDVLLLYAAGTAGNHMYDSKWINLLTNTGKNTVIFLRHKSGPVYLWYEIAHTKLLRSASDSFTHPHIDIEDIVVDDYNKVLMRLRALYGLKNIRNTRILAVGGLGSWGGHSDLARKTVNEVWGLEVKELETTEFVSVVKRKLDDRSVMAAAEKETEALVSHHSTLSVNTRREFIVKTFILYHAMKDLMEKYGAEGVTINGCMDISTLVETTPCLAFTLINDEGLMAFCESDFNVIPCGILLRHISGKPVFLNNPTFPNDGITTCAHCHSPRRMNGQDLEPTHIYTHIESDYGAAPKVEFKKGQKITSIIPNFGQDKWLGFSGTITDHPFYPICRSQFECTIDGNWKKLLEKMHGFHWMTCYGNYLGEMSYAAKKSGIQFDNISEG